MFLRKKDFLAAIDHYKEAALFLQGGSGKRMFTSSAREEAFKLGRTQTPLPVVGLQGY